jgi:hypothetical protein
MPRRDHQVSDRVTATANPNRLPTARYMPKTEAGGPFYLVASHELRATLRIGLHTNSQLATILR